MNDTPHRQHDLDRDNQLDAVDLRQMGPRLKRLIWSTVFAILATLAVAQLCWILMTPVDNSYYFGYDRGAWRAMGFFSGGAGALTFGATNWLMKRRDDRATPPVPTASMRR